MPARRRFVRVAVTALASTLLLAGGCASRETAAKKISAGELTGLFRLSRGFCDEVGLPQGSWMRVVRPSGTAATGPFVPNPDSSCLDKNVTPIEPGSDGGIRTGRYQADPVPAFDESANATAHEIIRPTLLSGVRFALATNRLDPQQKLEVGPPRLAALGRVLRGDLRGMSMPWNGEFFNQGAPKPDGSRPPGTTDPAGAYDAATRTFTLEWTSAIVGGSLNNCYGVWHLEGRFEPD